MVKIYYERQGLLSVDMNGKPSGWKIANRGGVWQLYQIAPYRKLPTDLAPFINRAELSLIVGNMIRAASKRPISMRRFDDVFEYFEPDDVCRNGKPIADCECC